MNVHRSTSQRLHDNLADYLNHLNPGDRLPSEPALAQQLGVSRATLREAMRTFEIQGLLHRRQGAGTFVAKPPQVIASGMEVLESIETLANRIGLSVALGEYRVEERPGTEKETDALGIQSGAPVTVISRVILAERQPAAFLVDVLPVDILSSSELQEEFTGSVLDLLLHRRKPKLATSRCEINAVTASSEVARAMGIQRGDVLLRFIAYLFSSSGEVVDYSFSYFLPGIFRFHIVRRVG